MGLINDLAVLVGNGVTVDTIKEIVTLEKGGAKNEGNDTGQAIVNESEDNPIDEGTKAPPEGDKKEPEPTGNEELEAMKKELAETKTQLAEAQAQIESMQEANKHRNRDEDSTKSTQDLLNDIMLEMY